MRGRVQRRPLGSWIVVADDGWLVGRGVRMAGCQVAMGECQVIGSRWFGRGVRSAGGWVCSVRMAGGGVRMAWLLRSRCTDGKWFGSPRRGLRRADGWWLWRRRADGWLLGVALRGWQVIFGSRWFGSRRADGWRVRWRRADGWR